MKLSRFRSFAIDIEELPAILRANRMLTKAEENQSVQYLSKWKSSVATVKIYSDY